MKKKKALILTSGGDAPGMNAAIRSLVRTGLYYDLDMWGALRGYKGLIHADFIPMHSKSVSNIIQRGGTVLKTSRCKEFTTQEGREKAKKELIEHRFDVLFVIGGDGSFRGASELEKIWSGSIIGIPATIDNDLYGSDFTIGYDTAVNTAMEAIDKVRDTADSHERFFLIEVMGRHAGFISLDVGISGGAEEIIFPECKKELAAVAEELRRAEKLGKKSLILVVAEGSEDGNAFQVEEKLREMSGLKGKVLVLGHIQRGGRPSASDRILATKLGNYAVEVFLSLDLNDPKCLLVGEVEHQMRNISLYEAWKNKKPLNEFSMSLISILSN